MKKLLVILAVVLMPLAASAQFEEGKVYSGASLTGLNLSYSGAEKFNIGLQGQLGYFVADDVQLYVQGGWQHAGDDLKFDQVELGGGGRYYIIQNGIFLGASGKYIHASSSYNDFMPGVEVGYAFFINRTVTIEPAIYYDQSFKKHSDYSTVGFRIGIGINLFQNTPSYFR